MADASPVVPAQRVPLKTKLYMPQLRSGAVRRPGLLARLDDTLRRKLLLIAAPPGFGKTALLSEWRLSPGGRDVPTAWLSLDEADNDPARFWFYVIAAIETVYPGAGGDALALLQSTQTVPHASILLALINDLVEVEQDFVLVLDDLHLIESGPIFEGLAFLLEHLPRQMHLVLITRADPPLPLARLRARGELLELRAKDLRFTPEEAAEFLGQWGGVALTPAQSEALNSRTEGWAAGLQLAALSLQGTDDLAGFMAEFMGNHRYVMDYLVEEVLGRQPEPIQQFLLATALLPRLCGPLCDAVTGESDGQATLERLEHAGLFLIPLDGERRWYRYHQMFADMLQARLANLRPGEAAERSRRACRWYEANGLPVDAFDAAVSAGETDHAAELLERGADAYMQRGEMATVQRMIGALPEAAVRTRPGLCALQARVLLTTDLAGAEQWLSVGEAALAGRDLTDSAARQPAGRLKTMRTVMTRLHGDMAGSLAVADEAMALLPEEDFGWRSLLWVSRAIAYNSLNGFERCVEALDMARRTAERAGDLYVAALSACPRAEMSELRGDLRAAEADYRWVLELGGGRGAQLPVAGWARIGLAKLLCEWNQVDEGTRWLEEGLRHGERYNHLDTMWRGYMLKISIALDRGDIADAERWVAQLAAMVERFNAAGLHEVLSAMRVVVAVKAGRAHDAEQMLDSLTQVWDASFHWLMPALRAQVLLAQGRGREAVSLLSTQLTQAESSPRHGMTIQLRAMLALAYQAAGDTAAALAALREAVAAGEACGFFRTFVTEGEPMARLLRRLPPTGYVNRLLEAMGEPAAVLPTSKAVAQPMAEPLSERELEVLRMMAEGLSNQEISEQAFIAVGTVKRHVHNILGKLEVRDRTGAIARARKLGLL